MLSPLLNINSLSAFLAHEVRARPGRGTLSSLLWIRRTSAALDRQGPMDTIRLLVRGGTITHCQPRLGTEIGMRLCNGFGGNLKGSLGFGCGCGLLCFPGPPSCVVPACWEASSPPLSIPGVLSPSVSPASGPGATPWM